MYSHLTPEILQELVSKLHAIRAEFTGDGAGLSGGTLSDKFLVEFLPRTIPGFVKHQVGESDMKVLDYPLSLKKISGKSTIALDWSKNGDTAKPRERFETDMMIINLKTEQWWKSAPKTASEDEKTLDSKFFSTPIHAGIYFVSHTYCRENVCLKSNNKTNTLIDTVALYKMLKQSLADNMVIEFPTEFPATRFDILKAFESV
jgi:hypothetical protein